LIRDASYNHLIANAYGVRQPTLSLTTGSSDMKTIGIENSKSSVQAHLTLGTKTMGLGIYGAYLALAIIYFWFGGMKFTHYEAEGLVPLVSNSPLLGWVYSIFRSTCSPACSAY
jgi:hypothetical protein